MRVLQLSPYSRVHVGGSQNFCFQLSKRLKNHGHDVEVWTSRYPRDLPKIDYTLGFATRRFFMLHNIWQLNPTTLLINDFWKSVKRFDIVHCHSYVFFSSNEIAFCRLLKKFPYVLHLHGGLGDLNPELVGYKRFIAKRFFDKTVGALTIKKADRIISVSQVDADYVLERYNIPEEKMVVIPNAVDSSCFPESKPCNPPVVCYVGRLVKWKGTHQMPKIFNTLIKNGVRVRVVGYGPEEQYLKQYCTRDVEFSGYVKPSDIPNVLSDVSCLLLPSFMEGLPTVCLEAMACGIPSIAYDVGGVKECVRNGVSGYVVPKGDINAFVDKTLRVVESNGFKENCISLSRRVYDWNVVTERIEQVYRQVLNMKR